MQLKQSNTFLVILSNYSLIKNSDWNLLRDILSVFGLASYCVMILLQLGLNFAA